MVICYSSHRKLVRECQITSQIPALAPKCCSFQATSSALGYQECCHVWLLQPQTVACQAPLSMGFSRQEYWSRLPFSSSGDLPNRGIEPTLQADSLPLSHLGSTAKIVGLTSPSVDGLRALIAYLEKASWVTCLKEKRQELEAFQSSPLINPEPSENFILISL